MIDEENGQGIPILGEFIEDDIEFDKKS